MVESIRYVAAVVVGVVATGAVGITLGGTAFALFVLIIITLIVGKWRRFAPHNRQAAVVGLFAFVAADEEAYLLALPVTVLSGAASGVVASALIGPRIRFSDAASAVHEVADALTECLTELGRTLRSGEPLRGMADLRGRLADLADLVDRSRTEIDFNDENLKRSLDRYEADQDNETLPNFLADFGRPTEALARVSHAYGELHCRSGGPELDEALETALHQHRRLTDRLAEHAGEVRALADLGALLIDAERFIAEFQYALDHDERR